MDPMILKALGVPVGIILFLLGAQLVVNLYKSVHSLKVSRNGETQVNTINTEMLSQMRSISSSLAITAERLGNLPTKAEVMGELRGHIRHDISDKVTPVVTELGVLSRSVDTLAAEVRQKR